jgi:predicted GIY-YIG superfamily endonuclease
MSWRADLDHSAHAVYRSYDSNGLLLYAGITCDPDSRLRAHRSSAKWVPYCADYDLTWFPDRRSALGAEAWVIRHEHPAFNAAGSVCFCGGSCETCVRWMFRRALEIEANLPFHEECPRPYRGRKGRLVRG